MTVIEATAALALIQKLTVRAINIVSEAPYWVHVDEPELASLDINGADASLTLVSAQLDDDEPTLAVEGVKFPSALLFLSDTELADWKREHKVAYDRGLQMLRQGVQ